VIRIEEAVDVGATAQDAFEFVTRIAEYPSWLPGVLRADPTDPTKPEGGAPVQGEGFRLVSSGPGGIEIVATGLVESVDPPRSIAISATSSLFRIEAICTVEPQGETRSRISVRAAIEPRGLAKLAAGRIEQELRAAVPDTLQRLREAVEAAPAV
jgi:carbon monoxide dehydrogenase subunit G